MNIIVMCFSMIVLSSCSSSKAYELMHPPPQKNSAIAKTLKGVYNINTICEQDVSTYKLKISFNDSTSQISGFSGCNRFFGNYTLNHSSLYFRNLGQTKLFCSKDKNKVEHKLQEVLKSVDRILFTAQGFSLYNKKQVLLSATKILKEDTMTFEYIATSRGFYRHIKIEKAAIFFSNKKGSKFIKLSTNEELWKKLSTITHAVDLKNISNLKAPSQRFLFDGAPMAKVSIYVNGNTYTSAPFDHGNTPEKLKSLVKEILSAVENVE